MNCGIQLSRCSGAFWSRIFASLAALLVLVPSFGCASEEKLPAEDLEVMQFYDQEIKTLQNPKLPPNSREKYEAAKVLAEKVDFTLLRELNTMNAIFYHGDAMIDTPDQPDRSIAFYYPFEGHYVRFIFHTYKTWVLRAQVDVK
ncbi:MAG: hypothetical protein J6Y54_02625 [Lentisphaeria bacterium]|nr:hypothetical protein [Lentisphaeria bacterium]